MTNQKDQTVELSVEERVEGLLILDNDQYDEWIVYDPTQDEVVDRFQYGVVVVYNGLSSRLTREFQREKAVQFAAFWTGQTDTPMERAT